MTSTTMLENNLSSDTSTTSTTTTTILSDLISTTIKSNLKLLDQLFLQTTTCQVISGFFAWAALILTIHHVSIVFFVLNLKINRQPKVYF
jgi:hypothetical protein